MSNVAKDYMIKYVYICWDACKQRNSGKKTQRLKLKVTKKGSFVCARHKSFGCDFFGLSLLGPSSFWGGFVQTRQAQLGGPKLPRSGLGGVFVTLELARGQSAARNSPSKAVFLCVFWGFLCCQIKLRAVRLMTQLLFGSNFAYPKKWESFGQAVFISSPLRLRVN